MRKTDQPESVCRLKFWPSVETVGAVETGSANVNVPAGSWATLVTINVPDVDHEVYTVHISSRINTVLEGQTGAPRHKIVDTTPDPDDEYPNSNGVTSFVSMDYKPNFETTITIPRNVKGHSLQIKGYNDRGVQVNYDTYVSAWGHTPHRHQ